VVKIGTRAVISVDAKPMLATHWDGYPASLGRDLLRCDKSIEAVIEVAKAHTIDSADASLLNTLNSERVTHLAEKHQLTVQEIKAGIRRAPKPRSQRTLCAKESASTTRAVHPQ
jgi:hypothetical protein